MKFSVLAKGRQLVPGSKKVSDPDGTPRTGLDPTHCFLSPSGSTYRQSVVFEISNRFQICAVEISSFSSATGGAECPLRKELEAARHSGPAFSRPSAQPSCARGRASPQTPQGAEEVDSQAALRGLCADPLGEAHEVDALLFEGLQLRHEIL